MKIVHCANFSYPKNGSVFYSTDAKITHGLNQNGHMVYDFSYRDQAKLHRFLGFKRKSIQKMNEDLIQVCQNIQPDLLLMAKAELISTETLITLKTRFPKLKIAQWFVDFLEDQKKDFFDNMKYIDVFFMTSAENLLDLSSKYTNTHFAYMPNIADPAFEQDTGKEKIYDVIYIARDYKEDNRYKFAVLLKEFCENHNLKLKLFASLGQPTIFGHAYHEAISAAKIAINFNRTDHIDHVNPEKLMGSSDRMNHMMGIGTCLFSPRIQGLDMLYKDKEDLIYFDSFHQCGELLLEYLKNGEFAKVAKQGQKRVFEVSNAQRITKYMLEILFENSNSDNYEWHSLQYKNGRQLC